MDDLLAEDEKEIFASKEGYLSYLNGEFDADVDFVRQNVNTQLENVPTELPESLDDQDNNIPTLLPEAVEAVAEANNLVNFVGWLTADGDPFNRVPAECVD